MSDAHTSTAAIRLSLGVPGTLPYSLQEEVHQIERFISGTRLNPPGSIPSSPLLK